MLMYPTLNPVAFHIGSWPVYWYGMMYLIGFVSGWALLKYRLKTHYPTLSNEQLHDLVFYVAMGAVIGGRLGYILFYSPEIILRAPWQILQTWKGGMSFHGGLIGVLIALIYFCQKVRQPWLGITDFICPVVPIGLGAGRIGNFINGELWGNVTTVPWGMVFPHVGSEPRHPSQLYEFGLEGVILFLILWFYSAKPRARGAVSGVFALCYALFRILVECYRQPDYEIGYLAFGWLTEGQLLSLPLLLTGIYLIFVANQRERI